MRRVLILRNPAAGVPRRSSSHGATLVSTLRALGHPVSEVLTAGPGDALRLARTEGGAWDVVVSAGGDGTANEVANGLILGGHRTPLVVAPLGTGNDLATVLGTGTVSAVSRVIGSGDPVWVDAIELVPLGKGSWEPRYGLLFAGCGLATSLLEFTTGTVKRLLGARCGYAWGFFKALRIHRPRRISIRYPGGHWESDQADVCVAAKAPHGGGGTLRLAPKATLTDGLLHGICLGSAGRLEVMGHFLRLMQGTHTHHPDIHSFSTEWMEVETDPPMPVALDGEVLGSTPVRIQVRRRSLSVLASGAMP